MLALYNYHNFSNNTVDNDVFFYSKNGEMRLAAGCTGGADSAHQNLELVLMVTLRV